MSLRIARALGWRALPAGVALAALGISAGAQQPAAPPQNVPDVGQVAPDFSLPAATRYGLLANPVRLSDLRGQTVVLAFFFQARTKG